MGPKYEFTDETMNHDNRLLHRIKRLSDGKIGGWIESEDNLSQEGNCWVDDNAKVYDEAQVYGNAKVYGNAEVYWDAQIYGDASICGNADVSGDAQVYGHAWVYDEAQVYGDAKVYDNAKVFGNAEVYGNAMIYGNAKVYDNAKVDETHVFNNAQIYNNAKVENAQIYDEAQVYGNAKVYGAEVRDNAQGYGYAKVYEDACVCSKAQVHGNALVCSDAFIGGNIEITDGEYFSGKYYGEESLNEVIQDFIYKVDDSNKITAQTEYDSIDEFFDEPITNDINLDTLVICTVDTKEPLVKVQKIDNNTFKFIVEITSNEGDDFIIRSIIKSQEHLNELIQQTMDSLRNYPQFSKYADTLEECL